MMKTDQRRFLFNFSFRLLILVLIVGAFQGVFYYYYQNHSHLSILLLKAYLFNYSSAVLFITILAYFKEKVQPNLGYVYLGFSMLKFIFFLVFLRFDFEADNHLRSVEFLTFFVSYVLCLIYEIRCIVNMMNRQV
jgi:hypothetical protein